METITFYSYKGGVGRTLLVANLARHLARFGRNVVAVDFDLEAPGLHYKFALNGIQPSAEAEVGLVDIVTGFLAEGCLPPGLDRYVIPVAAPSGSEGWIRLLPAGHAPYPDYWCKLSSIQWHDLFYTDGGTGVPLFIELKERLRKEYSPDYLLIDSRTGVTEIGGVATTLLPDRLVCLLLNNRENREGAREVLRSVRRARRLSPADKRPVDIVPVVCRIPATQHAETEAALVEDVRRFLNEEASSLEDTLDVSKVLVLHSEPELELTESLRIGGAKSPDESVLLRDYLMLFSRLFPPAVFAPNIEALVQREFSAVLDDPDGTERQLEELAETYQHRDAYSALLKFYRLRGKSPRALLGTAQRLWEVTGAVDEPLLWEIVREHFPGYARRVQEGATRQDAPLRPDFVEAVWRASGGTDPAVGLPLAALCASTGDTEASSKIALAMVERNATDAEFVARCLDILREAKDWGAAQRVINRCKVDLKAAPRFQLAWGETLVRRADLSEVQAALQDPGFALEMLKAAAPSVAAQLLALAGRTEELEPVLEAAFGDAVSHGPSEELVRVARLFARCGRSAQFEMKVRAALGEDAEDFLRHARRYGYERYR